MTTAPTAVAGDPQRGSWLLPVMPLGRVAALRTLVYAFVFVDVFRWSSLVRAKGDLDLDLYQPLRIARLLTFIPEPTHLVVEVCYWSLLVLAPLAATGRLPRLLGASVFLLYGQWMLIAMSYGKVDHDRFAMLIALALLPTVGRARHGDLRGSQAAGWALRVIQLAVIATYFLAAWAKMRFGGLEWLTNATLAWAILRRGTSFSTWLLAYPVLLQALQVGIVAFEAASPVVFVVGERWRRRLVAGLYGFHVVTGLAITITFTPHLVAMTCFFPLERLRPVEALRRRWPGRGPAGSGPGLALAGGEGAGGGAAGHPVAVAGHPPVGEPGDPPHRRG